MNENPQSNVAWEDRLTSALRQSPRVPVENEHRARRFHKTDKDNEQECE